MYLNSFENLTWVISPSLDLKIDLACTIMYQSNCFLVLDCSWMIMGVAQIYFVLSDLKPGKMLE